MLSPLLFALTLTVNSDTTLHANDPVELDPIIVVGQRQPVRLSRAVNSSIRLSPQKIAAAPEDNLLDYLAATNASITVTSVRGVGYGLGPFGQGKLLIRGLGFSPNRGTLVLTDGRPDIASLFGHPLPDTYLRAGMYSAELVKGGASTLYGSNAMAGVLDIQSFYRPDLPRYTNVELSTGSWNTRDGLFQHSVKVGRAILAGWGEYIESDNDRENSEYVNRAGGFRTQFEDVGNWQLFVSGKYANYDFADPGPVYKPARSTGHIERAGATFGADYQHRRLSSTIRLFTNYGEHRFSDGFHSVDRNHGLDVFARMDSVGTAGLSLSGGFSVNNFGGSAFNNTPAIAPGNFSVWEYAGHAQAEYQWRDLLTLTAGGRYVNHDIYNSHATFQVGAVVTPGNLGSFKASVATAYRNPTISELFLLPPRNADSLKPEEGTFYELGYFRRFGDVFSIEAATFWREGDNLIVVVPPPPPPPRFVNSGHFSHWGFEAKLRFAWRRWSVQPSFMHLNQKELNNSVPDDKFALAGEYRQKRWSAGIDVVAAFNTHADSLGTPVVLDDYVVANGHGSLRLSRNLRLKLAVDNLFDTKYETVSGYPMPGINLRTGLAVSFE